MLPTAQAVRRTAVSLCLLLPLARGADPADANWPRWRGPTGNGVAPAGNPVTEWSETANVRWKVALPGRGTSTPIVWGDQVFVLASEPATTEPAATPAAAPAQPPAPGGGFNIRQPAGPYRFLVLCLDRQTGAERWRKVACEEVPHEGHHPDHGFASASPVTDGQRLLASFGSRGLYAYDLQGNALWQARFGQMKTRNSFGEGSSPALAGDRVVVLWDHEGDDFIAALDAASGKELWRQTRDEPTGWTTPYVTESHGRTEVLVSGTQRIRSYDLATGEFLWECAGMTTNAIPSPVVTDGVAYFISGYRGSALRAIRLGGRGDLTTTDSVLWKHDRQTPYVPSPLLYDGLLYFLANNTASLSCLDAKTGAVRYETQRLPGMTGVYASPVGAAGRVYIAGRDGRTAVLKHGPTFEVLATNTLNDAFDASPAVVGDELFLRGRKNLYCIAASAAPAAPRN